MANNAVLEVLLKLKDELSASLKTTEKSIETLQKKTLEASRSMRTFGREMSQVGNTLAMVGTAGIAPFALSLKTAENYSLSVATQMSRLQAVMTSFQVSIATAVLPVVERFANVLNNLNNWFQALPKSMRETILQKILLYSAITLVTGAVVAMAGKLISLIANIAAIVAKFGVWIAAITLVIGGIVLLIQNWDKVREHVIPVLNMIEKGFNNWLTWQTSVHAGFIEFIQTLLDANIKLAEIEQKLPFMKNNEQLKLAIEMSKVWKSDLDGVKDKLLSVGESFQKANMDIESTGMGKMATAIDTIHVKYDNFFKFFDNMIKKFGKTTTDITNIGISQWQQFAGALGQLSSALQGAAAENRAFAIAAKVAAIGLAIVNTALGITDVLAKAPVTLKFPMAAMIAAAGAIQIATIAAQGFAQGTDNVPAMLSSGEMVVPRTFADAIRSGDLSLSGAGAGTGINVYIENASFNREEDIQNIMARLSYLIENKRRGMV